MLLELSKTQNSKDQHFRSYQIQKNVEEAVPSEFKFSKYSLSGPLIWWFYTTFYTNVIVLC
jgi:hypothetical protein